MARSLNEIQDSILTAKSQAASLATLEVLTDNEKNTLVNLTSTSKVAIWRLWVFIVSVGIWTLEQLFDIHKTEINDLIALNKIHNFDWYIDEAKAFQFGFSLNNFGEYDNTGVDENLLIASKIVKQVAIEQLASKLQIKIAKEDSTGELMPLTQTETASFSQYMERRKDAGTHLIILSRVADDLKVNYDIFYDSQVLDLNGQRHDGTDDTPVQSKIQQFTRELEFNGELILTKLTDFLQTIEGVSIPVLKSAEAKYAANPYTPIDERYVPDSGYFKFDEANSTLTFIDVNE